MELTKENTMTVKEVAEALNVSDRTIRRHAGGLGLTKNGKITHLNEKQVTIIKLEIERSGRKDLDNVVQLPQTVETIKRVEYQKRIPGKRDL